ncbi:SMC-Scp complex subunit ScpB [Candidatus Kaiserbacteria bacterium]|nr:SMC-Scp complex subunit ScpB [Candidatus Kaiserbacteria bacterium]
MSLDVQIEGLLFYKSSPVKKKWLCSYFSVSEEELTEACEILQTRLQTGATRLVNTDEELQLMTAPEIAPLIEAVHKDDMKADIGKAGAETLAIIMYKQPVSRAEIDQIRGVNSAFILRNLMTRGLITRSQKASRSGYEFSATPELMAQLGIEKKQDLTEFSTVMDTLETFTESKSA